MSQQKNIAIVIMGVSGVGKSTIGALLSNATGIPFFDGDDFHSQANIAKMAAGKPLNDTDRQGWLERLHQLIQAQLLVKGCIIACSALKNNYRNVLSNGLDNLVQYVYLHGSYDEILQRLQQRKGHFMQASLLQSQFETLEVPTDALVVSITKTPETIVAEIIASGIVT